MSVRNRVVLAVVWVLSLVAVSQWTAAAQAGPPNFNQPPGYEVRFVETGFRDGSRVGNLMVLVNGKWEVARIETPPPSPGIRPAR